MSKKFLIRPLAQVCMATSTNSIPSLVDDLKQLLPPEQQDIFENSGTMDQYIDKLKTQLTDESPELAAAKKLNIFRILGLYNSFNNYTTFDITPKVHLNKDPDYCDKVDVLNLLDPSNLFEKYQIWNTVPFGTLSILYTSLKHFE